MSIQEQIAGILKSDLTDGAKLAAIAIITTGAKTIEEIANATNRSARTVERHYAKLRNPEYAELRKPYADLRKKPTQICGQTTQICGTELRKSAEDQLPDSRARIESTLRVDTLSEEVVEESATAVTAATTRYAFEGRLIRLKTSDFDRWKKIYPAVPDLTAMLEKIDAYYREKPPPDGKWFFRVARWLEAENAKALQAREQAEKPSWQEEKRRRDAEFLRLARGETLQ